MTNLQPYRKEAFKYRTGGSGSVIEVSVHYSQGHHVSQRGIWFALRPMELENERGVISESFLAGCAMMLAPTERSKPKLLRDWAERVDSILPELISAWLDTGNATAVEARLKSLFSMGVA